jgi:hypothetical protein
MRSFIDHVYRTVVNPTAVTTMAISALNISPSTDRVVMAAPVAPVVVPEGTEGLPVVVVEVNLLELGVLTGGKDDDTTNDATEGIGGDDVAGGAETDPEDDPPGGGFALVGFASAPVPHGIGLPSG